MKKGVIFDLDNTLYNYDKCGSYFNNIKYCTETRILKYDK